MPDGRHAYIARPDGRILILDHDAATGDIVFEAAFKTGLRDVRALAISPDGRHLYASSVWNDAVAVLERDAASGGLRRTNVVFGGPGDDVPWLR